MSPRAASAEKKQAILDAALELFVEMGFHGTAVPEIARRAHVGAGTIYRYFDSKEAIGNELYRSLKSDYFGRVLDAFPFDAPPREQFHVFWMRMSEYARDNTAAMAFMENHHHGSYLDEESRALERSVLEMCYGVVAGWREAQVVKDVEPALLIAMIWGAFGGIHKACWLDYLTLTPELLAEGEHCVWEAIRR